MLQQRISVHPSNMKTKCSKLIDQLPKIAALVFITLLFLLGMQRAAFAVLAAVERSEQEWKTFRDTYPFHLQVVGLTPPLSDQSRVLIISEPPPDIKPDYFQKLADSVGGKFLVKTHSVGYDGWTRDAVLALPPLSEQELANFLAKIHQRLYRTTYKAHAVRLPIEPPPKIKRSLDLSVSVGDLNSWLIDSKLGFTSILGGTPQSLSEILSTRQSGVFVSTQRGLVIWSIPRGREHDLANYQAEARQFFLDSDLIVGAVANEYQLAIVARERVEPLLKLPPLRVETALMFAAEKSGELLQSYEMFQLFTGRLPNGKDLHRIYLSDGLINTEFGNLLNFTDELLKSWSLNGATEFSNRYPQSYPKPNKWAKFPYPMMKLIEEKIVKESGFMIFNWNNTGAGYTTTVSPYDFFAIPRTGALPITYLTNQNSDLQAYEKIAYDYFAGLSNPDFARVVQYVALYQIFQNFGIKTRKSSIQGGLLPGAKVLEVEASLLLMKLQKIPSDKLSNMIDAHLQNLSQVLQMAVKKVRYLPKHLRSSGIAYLLTKKRSKVCMNSLTEERYSGRILLFLKLPN